MGGRQLFGRKLDYDRLRKGFESGMTLRRTQLSSEFGAGDLMEKEEDIRPAFVVRNGRLTVVTTDGAERALQGLQNGDTVIWLPISDSEAAQPSDD